MNIRPAIASDAHAFAALVRAFESTLVAEPDKAEPFWQSMSEQAHSERLASAHFLYYVAESNGEVLGFIALRDGSHLFGLFVSPQHHRRGVGRALWSHALNHLAVSSPGTGITVNASPNAVPVYQAFGFAEVGPLEWSARWLAGSEGSSTAAGPRQRLRHLGQAPRRAVVRRG